MPRVSSTLPTEADACRCLAAIDASGMSFYAWCRANKIPPSTLERWRQRLTGPPAKIATRESVPRLVEVVVRPAAVPSRRSTEGPRYSVAVNDLTITVGDDFADATLARLLLLARSC